MTRENYTRSLVLVFWSVALTALTVVLGAVPMHGLRRVLGRGPYWLLFLGLSLLFWGLGWSAMAVSLFFISLLVGFYNELAIKGSSNIWAGFNATAFAGLFAGLSFTGWAYMVGGEWHQLVVAKIDEVLNKVLTVDTGSDLAVNTADLVAQLPSAVIIVFMLSLMVALIFESRLLAWLRLPKIEVEKLNSFRVPDYCVWFLTLSLLGAFLKTEVRWIEVVSVNVLNVTVVLYFFQGLAVISRFFEAFNYGTIWRAIWYAILVTQLFILVSLIGLLDYWMDFRPRFSKKAAEMKKEL